MSGGPLGVRTVGFATGVVVVAAFQPHLRRVRQSPNKLSSQWSIKPKASLPRRGLTLMLAGSTEAVRTYHQDENVFCAMRAEIIRLHLPFFLSYFWLPLRIFGVAGIVCYDFGYTAIIFD